MFGIFKKKISVPTVELHAPCAGEIIPISQVPDPTFAQGLLGPGYAVEPMAEALEIEICAPVTGTVSKIFKAGHAFSMISEEGLELLVHIGLETVDLKGKGFNKLLSGGEQVSAGTPVIRIDAAEIRGAGYQLITPVVLTKARQIRDFSLVEEQSPVVATVSLTGE